MTSTVSSKLRLSSIWMSKKSWNGCRMSVMPSKCIGAVATSRQPLSAMRNLRRAATPVPSRICLDRTSPRFSIMMTRVRPCRRFSCRMAGTSVSATLASSSSAWTSARSSAQRPSSLRTSARIPQRPIRKSAKERIRFDSSGNRATTILSPSAVSDRTASSMHESRWVLPMPRGPMKSRWLFDFRGTDPRRDVTASSRTCSRATVVWRRRSGLVTPAR